MWLTNHKTLTLKSLASVYKQNRIRQKGQNLKFHKSGKKGIKGQSYSDETCYTLRTHTLISSVEVPTKSVKRKSRYLENGFLYQKGNYSLTGFYPMVRLIRKGWKSDGLSDKANLHSIVGFVRAGITIRSQVA